jgi:hypothetical protein
VASRAVKHTIAVYASTPAYRAVLDAHGWGDAQAELGRLVKEGRWSDLADVVDDDMLRAFAIVAQPLEVRSALQARYGGLVQRVSFTMPYPWEGDRAWL